MMLNIPVTLAASAVILAALENKYIKIDLPEASPGMVWLSLPVSTVYRLNLYRFPGESYSEAIIRMYAPVQ